MVTISRAGITEWNYTSWTKKWVNQPAGNFYNASDLDVLIDEKNDTLSISYKDGSSRYRFGVYNISDFSAVYESPAGSHYTYAPPVMSRKEALTHGLAHLEYGGVSQSMQTYLLLLRSDEYTIEVWRGGASALWSRDTRTDLGASCWCDYGGISLRGKYVLVVATKRTAPTGNHLILYEGQ